MKHRTAVLILFCNLSLGIGIEIGWHKENC